MLPLTDDDPFVLHELGGRTRHTWADKWDFLLTAAGFTLGLNNIWRFPYFCLQNEPGSFLVAYLVLMLFVGIPLLCMEYAIGQLTQKGLAALANFCPILKGVVVTCLCASISIIFVYTAVNCWSVFYLFKSLFNLPTWSQCNNPWNSRHCLVEGPFPNATQLLIQRYKQYFINNRGALTSALLGTATGAVSAAPSLHSSAPLSLASNATSALFNSTALHALTSSLNATIPLTTPASRGTNNAPTNLVDQALIKQLLNGNFNALHSINLNAIPHVHNFSNLPYLINLASNLTTPINETAQPNQFVYNASFYATQEFHDHKLHSFHLGFNSLGIIRWEFAIPLFVVWITIFVSLRKHLTFSRHSTNCLAIIPFAFVFILVIRALMLPGAEQGIQYFLTPSWDGVLKPQVWLLAAGLCLHSIGSVLGTSISMAKCNKESNHFVKDALFVCFLNVFTVFLIGFIIFSTLGHLSLERNLDIAHVIINEPSAAFVVFSEFLMTMPFPTLWALAFFLLLFLVGTDYQIGFAVTLLTTLQDLWGPFVRRHFFSRQLFILLVCSTLLVFNSFFITQKAILLIVSIETYVTVWLTVLLAIIEIIIIGWIYGGNNFANVIKQKTSKKVGFFFPICWNYFTPILLITILGWNICFYESLVFRTLTNSWLLRSGLVMACIALAAIPLYAFLVFGQVDPDNMLVDKFIIACRPNLKWFTESELLYNDKYNSNFPSYLHKTLEYTHVRLTDPSGSNQNGRYVGKSAAYLLPTGDMAPTNSLLANSKITYSIVQNLDKETTL